jgi:hypothetical protein
MGWIEDARYLSLTTFRMDGSAVATPVWFAPDGNALYIFTAGESGKVKRLRRSSRARIAPCTARGRSLGDPEDASARLVDDASEGARAYRALRRKYGWQMALTTLMSRLSGRFEKRALIAVTRSP